MQLNMYLYTRENLFFLRASGRGALIVNAFGRITEIDVDGEMVVDTGHLVAYEDTLEYTISKAGSSLISSFLSGEGLVMTITGKGKILVQSHNPDAFGNALGRRLPPRQQ